MSTPQADPAQVLIVEDHDDLAEALRVMLERDGHAVAWARDGRDALYLARGAAPDLIILDLGLPRLDGLSFARFVKAGPFKFTPIIMLTTESQDTKKAEGKAAGVRAWITKPFQPSQLVDAVSRLCM